jgi:hypothetical protein
MPYPVAAVRNKNFGGPLYTDLVLSLSPIAFWPFGEASGTTANDISGNGYNGTYAGVDLAQSGQGGQTSVLFGGSGDSCNVYSAGLAGAFSAAAGSIALWCKVYEAAVWTDTAYRNLATFYVDANNNIQIYKGSTNNRLSWNHSAGGTGLTRNKNDASSTDWMHLAITWSVAADQVIAYYNGAQYSTTATGLGTWAGALSNNNTAIGAFRVTTALQVWNGYAQYPALWNRALTPLEVAGLKSFFG